MQTHGLAAREGVEPRVVALASPNATSVALQGGAVDLIVTDWIWVSRQRAQGRLYTFVPYSLTVGGNHGPPRWAHPEAARPARPAPRRGGRPLRQRPAPPPGLPPPGA